MTSPTPISDRTRRGEAGFTLAGLIVILTIISILVAYTVPKQWSTITGRERDRQAIFAMKQYARGIRAFQLKNGSAPVSLDQLHKARTPRLIRGNDGIPDPLTGEVDWIPVPMTPELMNQLQQQRSGATPPPVPPAAAPQDPFPGVGYPGRVIPPGQPPTPQPGSQTSQPAPGSPGGFSGPIIGVRPNKTGRSYLTLNGAETYEQWMYTLVDLEAEIAGRQQSMTTK